MGVSATHILDELDFFCCVLIRVTVRTMRTVCQGTNCTIVLLSPTVDVLSGSLVADCCLCNTIFEGIFNYYLLKSHVLCYLTHSE